MSHDTELRDAAIWGFLGTVGATLLLRDAVYDVAPPTRRILEVAVLASAAIIGLVVHRRSTPTRLLPHPAKVRREQRHTAAGVGALTALLVTLGFLASFDLRSWAEWIVFGVIVAMPIAVAVAIDNRRW